MSDQFDDAGKRLPGLLFAIGTKLGDVRELGEQIANLAPEEKYVSRTVVVVNEPVEQARERLGAMVEHLGFLRSEVEHMQREHRATLESHYPGMDPEQLDAMGDLGCGPLLKTVADLERQYNARIHDNTRIHAHEPKSSDVSGLSVKRAAQEKPRERGAN